MEVVKNLLKRLSLRELCYVCLCVIIFYLFRARDTYYLIPTWRKRSQPHHYNNGKFPTSEEYLPTPVVTDLESDGLNEVVLVTVDGRLSVLVLPERPKMDDGSLPHVVVKNDVELQLTRSDGRIARPVLLETGFTVPYQSMMQIRKQIIVIVTDDWHVMCYDPDLTLKWEVTLPSGDLGDEVYQVKSLGALITSHSVQKNDGGLIIIGGNFMHKTHHTKELPVETVDQEGNKTQETKTVVEEVENLTHFSTFALSVTNGTIRWHHMPGDFGEQKHNIQDQESEHHWKLGLRKNRKHAGESPWKMYSRQLNQHMPYMWVNNQHTKFTLGRFAKDKQTGRSPSTTEADVDEDDVQISKHQSALSAQHIVGYAYGGHRPHSESEHASNPNAVVIRGPHGIEVLNLLSGQPITRLEITETRHIHFDVDGDGEMENLVWDLGKGHTACYLDIWRVAPVKEKLEQLSLCISQRLIWQRSWAMEEDVFNRVPPVLIKSVAKKSGVFRHLLGQHLTSEQEYDLISFGAVGRMSSFDLTGNIHWQVQTSCKWSELSIKLRRKSIDSVPQEIEEEFMQSFWPNFILLPLKVSDRKDVAAVVGWNSLSLVDLVDGTLLAEHSIPSPPTGPLAYGDFDNDGISDIILACKKGFIGFTVKQKANYEYTILYASAVLLIILFVTWVLIQPSEVPETPNK
ncbi:hypothetical protein BaRGS_00010655 [Batillaria attramentaria]|uniref:FG-GAP repeat-containing protein n=1 Tax=Batillaria attramentaria TaxID=370345 RepID=A0ABD0LFH1_9CAEN